MIRKKICMLGGFAVGKTSLVSRFVKSIFSEKYLTTIGVKIDKKSLQVDGEEVTLILWDLAGEDEFFSVPESYLRGSAGYLLVIDGTRRATTDQAVSMQAKASAVVGEVPFLALVNKADLEPDWEFGEEDFQALRERGWSLLETSAKDGRGVEEAFARLAELMLSA